MNHAEGAVLLRRREGVVEVLILNRPERRNAISAAVVAALKDAFAESAVDPDVRAVVLTGAGDKAFCAGKDLKDFAAKSGAEGGVAAPAELPDDARILHAFLPPGFPKPVVAALNGSAVGGGFELMLECDLVVAADHAQFGLPEVKRGLIPGGGGTLLATRIPLALALEITLTGDTFGAERALEIGLVNRVVPGAQVVDEAIALAGRIAENGPLAVAVVKRVVRAGAVDGGAAAWPSRAELREVFSSEDAREGAVAFIEKRTPRWGGRANPT